MRDNEDTPHPQRANEESQLEKNVVSNRTRRLFPYLHHVVRRKNEDAEIEPADLSNQIVKY